MQVSNNGLKFIETNEGFKSFVYNDNGNPAIGYGHDVQPGEDFSAGLTPTQAEQLLITDLSTRFEPVVNGMVPPECTQNQYDSLCDFVYNLGAGSFRTMMDHGWNQVPMQILRWNHVNGVVNLGLTKRRQSEVDLFNTP